MWFWDSGRCLMMNAMVNDPFGIQSLGAKVN